MAVKIVTQGGDEIVLNRSFRVRGVPVERNVPSLTVEGRNGEIVHEKQIHTRARTISVTGTIYGNTPEQAEESLDELVAVINKLSTVKLYRDENDDTYFNVRFTNIEHDYEHGTNRKVAQVTIQFVAHDPYKYATEPVVFSKVINFSPPITMIEVTNEGNVEVEPFIRIKGVEDGGLSTKNPKLTNYTTGRTLKFIGDIQEGDLVVMDSERRDAVYFGNGILISGSVAGGTAETVTLSGDVSSQDGFYVGKLIALEDGQVRRIVGYNGVTKIATVDINWSVVPEANDLYTIYAVAPEEYFVTELLNSDFVGGTPILDKMGGDFLVYGFPLAPGVNRIEVEDDNQLLDLTIFYRERWL